MAHQLPKFILADSFCIETIQKSEKRSNREIVMKKLLLNLLFAAAMVLSVAFVGEMTSSHNPFSANAQTVTVKKRKVGAIRKIYRGGKYVGRKVWTGTKWVGVHAYRGSKYIGKKTWRGTKYVGRKIKRAVY